MKIVGENIVLPRNFEFFRRLPSRFEILVIGKGAIRPEGSTFEIEIQGQRLTLRSKVELKPGARYELEKQSVTEFRIIRETETGSDNGAKARVAKDSQNLGPEQTPLHLMFDAANLAPPDLWKIHAFRASGGSIDNKEQKFVFDFESSVGLKGLFVPVSSGGYSLLVCGRAASNETISALKAMLEDLQIRSVARVDAATFEHIAEGAIDFSS